MTKAHYTNWCILGVNRNISLSHFLSLTREAESTLGKIRLTVAAREFLRGGKHDGPCRHDLPDGACSIHVETYNERRERLIQLLPNRHPRDGAL